MFQISPPAQDDDDDDGDHDDAGNDGDHDDNDDADGDVMYHYEDDDWDGCVHVCHFYHPIIRFLLFLSCSFVFDLIYQTCQQTT